MWVFYHASYGPGHQSGECDFEYFGNNYQKDDIDESLMNKFDDQDGVVLEWWKVDKPDKSTLNIKIGTAKAGIETYTEYLSIMNRETSFLLKGKDGVDKVLQRNLKKKDTFDVLRRLHKAGYIFSEMDINQWIWGKEWTIPNEPDRSKILRIIRRSKSY